MRRAGWLGLAALIGAALLTACGDDQTPATPPPATASADPSPAPTATATPSPGETATPAATAHPTAAPTTPSPTPTASATVAASPTPASTATPSPRPAAGAEQVGAALEALPWMRDGVSGDEEDAAATIRYAAEVAIERGFTDLLVALTERAWVRDGLAQVEISALFSLVSIAHRDADRTTELLEMPFLATVETGDLGMLQDLEQLPAGEFGPALASPRLEGGIGDGDEVAVSALRLASLDPEALSPDRAPRLGSRTAWAPANQAACSRSTNWRSTPQTSSPRWKRGAGCETASAPRRRARCGRCG